MESWRASGDRAAEETKVVGHPWSPRSHEVRDFLDRNSVPYRWYTVDDPEGRRLLEAAEMDETAIPLVVIPGGEAMAAPSNAQIASRVGLSTTPTTDFYDLVIVGGGLRTSGPRCTARPRACARSSWSGRRPVARPARARASRTTSASRTAFLGASSPSVPAARP